MPFFKKARNKRRTTMIGLVFLFTLAMVLSGTSYAAVTSVPVALRIDQVFTKNSSAPGVNSGFSYTLTSLNEGNPMPVGSISGIYSFTIDGTSSKNIDTIFFPYTGIYRYEIKGNTHPASFGYTYDNEVYSLTVYVRQTADGLSTDITARKSDGSKVGRIAFINTYTPLPSRQEVMVDPPVKKTVSGNPSKSSTFSFLLTPKSGANPMPEGSVNGVKTITITGSGKKDFGTWVYTGEGMFQYTISEVDTGESRYTYDTNVYTITDVVRDRNGQLEVTRTVTNRWNKEVESCIFINDYSGGGSGNGGNIGSSNGNSINSGPGIGLLQNKVPGAGVPQLDETQNAGTQEGDYPGGVYEAGVPKTGDPVNYEFYKTMFWGSALAALCCMIYLILTGRRKKPETEGSLGR